MKSKNSALLERFIEFGRAKFGGDSGWKARYAAALQMTPQQLSDILASRSPIGPRIREKLQTLLGCNIEWLLSGNGKMMFQEAFKDAVRHMAENQGVVIPLENIPVYEYARAGSKSLVLDGEPAYYIPTSKSKDDSRFGVVVKGKSMEPEIREGDVVVVSKKRDVENGNVCLVIFEDGETCIRRVYLHDHAVTLTSANEKDYPPGLHKKSEIRAMYRMVQKITNY